MNRKLGFANTISRLEDQFVEFVGVENKTNLLEGGLFYDVLVTLKEFWVILGTIRNKSTEKASILYKKRRNCTRIKFVGSRK